MSSRQARRARQQGEFVTERNNLPALVRSDLWAAANSSCWQNGKKRTSNPHRRSLYHACNDLFLCNHLWVQGKRTRKARSCAAKDGKEKYFWPPHKQTLPKVWSFPTGLEAVGPWGKRPLAIRLVSALKSDEAPLPTEALFIHNLGCVMAAELLLPELHNYQEDYVNIAKMNHWYSPYHLN